MALGILILILGIVALIAGVCLVGLGAVSVWMRWGEGRSHRAKAPGPLIAGSYSPEVQRLYGRSDINETMPDLDGSAKFDALLIGAGIVLVLIGVWLISL